MVKEEKKEIDFTGFHIAGTVWNSLALIVAIVMAVKEEKKRSNCIFAAFIALMLIVLYYIIKYRFLIKNDIGTDIWDVTYLILSVVVIIPAFWYLVLRPLPLPILAANTSYPYPYN
jgi:uncharacterized membrane protein